MILGVDESPVPEDHRRWGIPPAEQVSPEHHRASVVDSKHTQKRGRDVEVTTGNGPNISVCTVRKAALRAAGSCAAPRAG